MTTMPIRAEMQQLYPADWDQISTEIKTVRAAGRCECTGQCGRSAQHLYERCRNRHGQPAVGTGSTVVLTTAHLNNWPPDCRAVNLVAMCQGCHLHMDAEHHARTRAEAKAAELAATMDPLFPLTNPLDSASPDRDADELLAYINATPHDRLLIWADEVFELAPLAHSVLAPRRSLLAADDALGIRLWQEPGGLEPAWLFLELLIAGTWRQMPRFSAIVPGEERREPCHADNMCWDCRWTRDTNEYVACSGIGHDPVTVRSWAA